VKVPVVVFCLFFHTASYAQNHMIEFNAESILLGQYSFSDSKEQGKGKKNEQSAILNLNFARAVSSRLQVGIQTLYSRAVLTNNISETYYALVGAIYNFSDSNFTHTFYASAYLGMEWNHLYPKTLSKNQEEAIVGKISLGKRFPLEFISENFTFSPEVSAKSLNTTRSSGNQWTQEYILRFLQFSVFF
jgi:hypothetical protein